MIGTNTDLVVGIDCSTTATKAIAWNADGVAVAEGRSAVPMDSPAPNRYEQDPRDWWRSTSEALRALTEQVAPTRIAAVAISNQRETFAALDEEGNAVRPGIVWLDERCRGDVAWLAEQVGAERLHRISGKPVDLTPVAYRIAWMLRHEPDNHRRAAMFTDVHGYLVWRLAGCFRTSWASADPIGAFDMQTRMWSDTVLQALELTADRLPEAHAPGSVLGTVTSRAAKETGLLPETPVVAGGGDGQAAGLGVNALSSERAYLNLGTAVVSGVYARRYAADKAWRTMGSCSGEGYYYESCLRTGTFLVDWLVSKVCNIDTVVEPDIYQRLEQEAAASPIGSHGLLLVPYWGGVMTPYWEPDARGCMVGFSGAHNRGDMYRALLEGVALEQAECTSLAEQSAGVEVREYVAIGGGAASDLWCQIIADATDKRVCRSATVEASSLGAGICAAMAAEWYSTMEVAADAMSGEFTREIEPVPNNADRYRELRPIYRDIYPRLRDTFTRLGRFVEGA